MSDKVKRMGSARPLTAKKDNQSQNNDSSTSNNNNHNNNNSKVNNSGGATAPMRKIAPDQFYKPPNTSLTPSQSQPTNVSNAK